MSSHLRYFARRHRLVLPVFLLVMTTLLLPLQHFAYANTGTVGPSQVILRGATTLGHGVHISWIEAQSGTFPIAKYIIERSSDGIKFTQVGTVNATSFNFIDLNGQNNNIYQVIAEDNQKPAHRSLKSDPMTSTPVQPGSNTIIMPGPTTTIQEADMDITTLQKISDQTAKKINEALAKGNTPTLALNLVTIERYQQQILSLLPSLSVEQKANLVKFNNDQSSLISASLNLLPDRLQADGLLIQAGYQAIRDTTQ